MLNNKSFESLKKNWGDRADSMQCRAEIRLYDPNSKWQCYIYAVNPEYLDEIQCIIRGFDVEILTCSLQEILSCYNSEGESPRVDIDYRPIQCEEILKLLRSGRYGTS